MSLKTWITSRLAEAYTGKALLNRRRGAAERKRIAAKAPHVVDFFHQADDPYAHVVAQVLGLFAARYEVELRVHLCSPPPDWAAPDRAKLKAYARLDAARLAARTGLIYADPGEQPPPAQLAEAEALLAGALAQGQFLDYAAGITSALWAGAALPDGPRGDAVTAKVAGDGLRDRLGHYLGATFAYGGEWFWGLDRLHFLETRLAELGARRASAPPTPIFAPPVTPQAGAGKVAGDTPLEFFLSFRSPYTYIAASRARALAEAYGVPLQLRFVLPMVMRGLPVPATKRGYITRDTAREARRLGVPFGRIADPVGRPVERGYSLLPWAREQGRGFAYVESFLRGVWSEGIDAGSDTGLRRIVERADLPWVAARELIGNDDWRAEAEANRQTLLGLGLWGVPCFRYSDVAAWGQDRLWVIEEALRARIGVTYD
jgi:2-hydroxychromene-2-carboxylate isomerase